MKNKKDVLDLLEPYPNIHRYAEWWRCEHAAEHEGFLANITIWFRRVFDKAGVVDVPEYMHWPTEHAEEFYSWGTNSRWSHEFQYWYLIEKFKDAVKYAADLAKEFGDPDVEAEKFWEER